MSDKIAIIGASGHGKVVAEIAKLNGYQQIVFLDDDPEIRTCGSYQVRGSSYDAVDYVKKGYDLFVAIGSPRSRRLVTDRLQDLDCKDEIVTLVHPSALISESATIGQGSVIMAGAVINAEAAMGNSCIVNTCASVDHENVIGDYVHVAVGAHLAGQVVIGDNNWIGAGATVSNNISISADCIIGAGAVVVRDIHEPGTYVGCPAKRL